MIVRLVLLACAVLALLDGAVWEAAGMFVLAVFLPGWFGRPLGLRVWWWGGGWRA